jgi:hypothetical protein
MNALLNQPAFASALVLHLERKVKKNPFARRAGESDDAVLRRRFGEHGGELVKTDVQDLSMQYSFQPDTRNIQTLYAMIANNTQLREWARDVILTNMLRGAMTHSTDVWRKGGLAHDKQVALAIGRWSSGQVLPGSMAEGRDFVTGGDSHKALRNLFENCGLQVKYDTGLKSSLFGYLSPVVIARVPDCGTTLCVGGSNAYGATIGVPPDAPPMDGSVSGMLTMEWNDFHGEARGHAMAYLRNRDRYIILDSNGHTYSAKEAYARYIPPGVSYVYHYSPYYTVVQAAFHG